MEAPDGREEFIEGGAVLSTLCATAGGACYFAVLLFGFTDDAASAIARSVLGDRAAAVELASVAPIAAAPVLGIAAVALGFASRWRIRGAGTALSGGGLALLGITWGLTLLVLCASLVAGVVSEAQVDLACGGTCVP